MRATAKTEFPRRFRAARRHTPRKGRGEGATGGGQSLGRELFAAGPQTDAESNFSFRATDGERPVHRLKA